MITVYLPSQLSGLAAGRKELAVSASTLREVFNKLDEVAPMIRSQIFDSNGAIRQFVGLFLNEQQITEVDRSEVAVAPGSQLMIVVAVAGG